MTSFPDGGSVLVLYVYINVLYYYINVCLWKRKKERKRSKKKETLRWHCAVAYKIGVCMSKVKVGQTCYFSLPERSRSLMKSHVVLVLTLRRLALIELYDLEM